MDEPPEVPDMPKKCWEDVRKRSRKVAAGIDGAFGTATSYEELNVELLTVWARYGVTGGEMICHLDVDGTGG